MVSNSIWISGIPDEGFRHPTNRRTSSSISRESSGRTYFRWLLCSLEANIFSVLIFVRIWKHHIIFKNWYYYFVYTYVTEDVDVSGRQYFGITNIFTGTRDQSQSQNCPNTTCAACEVCKTCDVCPSCMVTPAVSNFEVSVIERGLCTTLHACLYNN